MNLKDTLANSVIKECKICQHLYTKIPEGGMDYRPTPDQRSTLELLRYLAGVGIGVSRTHYAGGDWEPYKEVMGRTKEMAADEFPRMMEEQIASLQELFASMTEGELVEKTTKLPTGEEVTLYEALLENTLKWMTGYRMQLFLYAKQAGSKEINTANNWAGIDYKG